MNKPLMQKAYGHIAHLPGSRMGSGDHKISDGQSNICQFKTRDKHDRIIVQEKLDGSNCSVARDAEGRIWALTRSGNNCYDSKFVQHHAFAQWVQENMGRFAFLKENERLVGEWLHTAHGTRYDLPHEPFVAFDLMQLPHKRLPFDIFRERASEFVHPRLIHDGEPFSIEQALEAIKVSGHGAWDPVEGAVWRVERKGAVDFLAKYVRPEKQDGIFLDAEQPILNTWPHANAIL